jgi:asparagine synthase (glutamine-hydrolysing)
MCGIAGFFSSQAVPAATCNRMLAALRQRGPDAQHLTGWARDWTRTDRAPHQALLHARLSIIDPRPIADQPMCNKAGDIWICYNGEVYDWADHAGELSRQGYEFTTRSDTEFILHAYEAWGMDMLPRLRGMFAIVILDLRKQKLWLVRDRMGLKPLVYSHLDGNFAFASTVRALLPFLPVGRRTIDPDAIDAYLAHRYIPAPMTVMTDIRRLENAHQLCFDLSTRTLTKTCYWHPEPNGSHGGWQAELDHAISLRTVADRPLGLFLSSGIDSSLVASRLAATGHAGLQTFTAGFSEASMNESPAATEIARMLGYPNRVISIPSRVRDDFTNIVADLDEPFADPSCIPAWYLARATTDHVKVVLGGDGGDELFAGYKRFDKHLRSHWRQAISIGGIPRSSSASLAGGGWRRTRDEARMNWHEAYSLRFSGFTPSQRASLQPSRRIDRFTWWRMPQLTVGQSPLKQLLEIDRLNYLPEYILRKGDLTTMAHGLELRAPLLDHHWVNLVTSLPDDRRFTKPAKQFVEPAMPALGSMKLFQRKKMGFNPPLSQWLREDLREQLGNLGARLNDRTGGQFDATAVDRLLDRYTEGDEHLAEQVLQLLVLAISLEQLHELAIIA